MATPNLTLTELVDGAGGNEFSYNDSLNVLDAVQFCLVQDRHLSAAPTSPMQGQVWIVDTGPTAEDPWFGHVEALAFYYNGWVFRTPPAGTRVWIADEDGEFVWTGSAWVQIGTGDIEVTSSFVYALKESDEIVSSSTTLQSDDNLLFGIGENETWSWQACLLYASAATPDIKVSVSIPSGTQRWGIAEETQNTSLTTGSATWDVEEALECVLMDGTVYNSGSSGTVAIQWAQNTSSGTPTTMKAGSWIRAWRDN